MGCAVMMVLVIGEEDKDDAINGDLREDAMSVEVG